MPITLQVSLVVDSWRGPESAPLSAEAEMMISAGDLPAGSTFPATIMLDADTAAELWSALQGGYQPVFWMSTREKALRPQVAPTEGEDNEETQTDTHRQGVDLNSRLCAPIA